MSELPEDRFGEYDDTLDDGDVSPPPPAARTWLARQRFVHGLLRALHSADASAREARVQAVMARVRAVRAWPATLLRAAAAILFVGLATWWAWPRPDSLPRAEALVERARASLADDVDRAFTLELVVERGGREVRRELDLVLRPGRRFLVEGDGPLGRYRVGCDGTEVWFDAGPMLRHHVPLDEATRLLERMGDLLDLGYLELDELVRRLPQADLRSTGREAGAVRVEAAGRVELPHATLDAVRLLVDESTGMIRSLDATATSHRDRPRNAAARIAYRYEGERSLGAAGYLRPWK